MKDIERFVDEITGVTQLKNEMKTTDSINHAAISAMRDHKFSSEVSPTIS